MVRVAVLVIAIVVSGCTVSLMKDPPRTVPREGPIRCDSSVTGFVVADYVVGTTAGALTSTAIIVAGALAGGCAFGGTCGPVEAVGSAIFVGAVVASPFYLSAHVGKRRAATCRKVKTQTGR